MASTILGIGGFFLSDSSCGICLANISKRHLELCYKLGFKRIFVIPSKYDEEGGGIMCNNFSSPIEYIKKKATLKCTEIANKILLHNRYANINLNYNLNNLCINYNYSNGCMNYNYCGGNISYSINNNNVSSNFNIGGNQSSNIISRSNGCMNYISNNINTNNSSCSQTIISNDNVSYEENSININNNSYNGRKTNININNNNNNNNNSIWINNNNNNNNNINREVNAPHIVIGTHTIVDIEGEILEKPKNEEDAYNMLCRLSDKVHNVHTAVAICTQKNGSEKPIIVFVETTKVYMQKLNERDINAYLKTHEFYNNVGAYSIIGLGAQIIKSIDGCFYNILGLPIQTLSHELTNLYNAKNICHCQ